MLMLPTACVMACSRKYWGGGGGGVGDACMKALVFINLMAVQQDVSDGSPFPVLRYPLSLTPLHLHLS